MCGKSDEDNLGFSYAQLDSYILDVLDGVDLPKETRDAIERKHTQNLHKLLPMPKYEKADYVE
jgi:NAD+ synthase